MTKSLGDVEQTARGFDIVKWRDLGGMNCKLQESSIAEPDLEHPGTNALWIGAEHSPMHLSREHVTALVAHLQAWLDAWTLEVAALGEVEVAE